MASVHVMHLCQVKLNKSPDNIKNGKVLIVYKLSGSLIVWNGWVSISYLLVQASPHIFQFEQPNHITLTLNLEKYISIEQ